jgi:hypothetical protein
MANPAWRDERVSIIANIAMIYGEKRLLSTVFRIFLKLAGKRIVQFSCNK